jgi:Na+/citrate or Na+/malate symporter
VLYILFVLSAAVVVLTVSATSFVGTQSIGYPLDSYITNALTLTGKGTDSIYAVASFSRLSLSFLAHLDPADTSFTFESTLQ